MNPKHTKRPITSSVMLHVAFVPSGSTRVIFFPKLSVRVLLSGVLCCSRDASFAHHLPVDGGFG